MINTIPILGWALSALANISLAVPFWFCWTVCGLGGTYFAFLPPQYHAIPFWECVGLFIVASILKAVLVPKLASVSQEVKRDKEGRT